MTALTYIAFDGAGMHTRLSAGDISSYRAVGFYVETTEQVAADAAQGWNWQVRSPLGGWGLATKPMADWARAQGIRIRPVRPARRRVFGRRAA